MNYTQSPSQKQSINVDQIGIIEENERQKDQIHDMTTTDPLPKINKPQTVGQQST